MSKGKVLVAGSNATRIEVKGGTGPTGQYLNETVVPVMALVDAGFDAILATPNGAKPHIDQASATPVHFVAMRQPFDSPRSFMPPIDP